jgi:hypothetical protein
VLRWRPDSEKLECEHIVLFKELGILFPTRTGEVDLAAVLEVCFDLTDKHRVMGWGLTPEAH